MTIRDRIRKWMGVDGLERVIATHTLKGQWLQGRVDVLEAELAALKAAPKPHKPDGVFDKGDKIAPTGPARYVPVARRRAAAEAASLGPQSHTEQLRANNAKAME